MTDDRTKIEAEVEVVGTPEEVWRAIATGPGISSWYVPHTIDERAGGQASARFGPGPEMEVPGRVVSWDPPRRVTFDGGTEGEGLAFEWLVEARDGGTCIVRLVNSGFGSGGEWDDQYDGMTEGWAMFLTNLRLHLREFAGDTATAALPTAMWSTSPDDAWVRLCGALGIDGRPQVGDTIAGGASTPLLAGTVTDVGPTRATILLDEPARGTALLAAEGGGDMAAVSVWTYLYGPRRDELAEEQQVAWTEWLNSAASTP